MTLQHIRRYYEQPIVDWCADTTDVELRVDNMLEPGGDANKLRVVVSRLNFGVMMTEVQPRACLLENIRGVLNRWRFSVPQRSAACPRPGSHARTNV